MSESRKMTAAEAANNAELWQAVVRGECYVRNDFGRMLILIGETWYKADYEWQPDLMEWRVGESETLTVVAIPVSEQSENSPANVERLKARIAALEAENAAMASYLNGVVFGDDIAQAYPLYVRDSSGNVSLVDAPMPAADSTSPASASDASETPTPHRMTEAEAWHAMTGEWLDRADRAARFTSRTDPTNETGAARLDADDDGSGKDVR